MKYFSNFLIDISCFICFAACSDDDTPIDDIESDVEYYVKCSLKDPKMHIDANGLPAEGVYFQGSFHHKCRVKDYFAVVDVTYKEDPQVWIDIKLIVNNKTVIEKSGKGSLFVNHRLKRKGPYLH